MSEPIVQLRGIRKYFGNKVILDGVDLDICAGDAVVVIGPSGTGKSTILRLIAGLMSPDEGEIYIKGVPRRGLNDEGKDPIAISMVFQNTALFDSLSVEENVGFYLFQHSKLPRKRIRDLVERSLEMVGLPGVADLLPAELSGGMRKRVSFARSILYDPDNPAAAPQLLLYDEPTAGLDPIASTVLEDLVRHLQSLDGVCDTYVMVSHQHSTIRRTAERVVFLYQGKVQWQGNIAEIDATQNPMVRQFFEGKVDGPIQAQPVA